MDDSERYQLRELSSYLLTISKQAEALQQECRRAARMADELFLETRPVFPKKKRRWWDLAKDN